jgi:aspartate/tyrosine/aromatic aminotransferase
MEYLPIEGLSGFIQCSLEMGYGKDNLALKEKRIAGIQALSGTGSLRIGFEFLNSFYNGPKTVLVPNPSWPNHKNVIHKSGMQTADYRYYDQKNKKLDYNGMMEDFDKAPEGTVVVLHVCAHNPTGLDPTNTQWDDMSKIFKKKKLFPFFDMAYQGFASGDLDRDSYGLRKFANEGIKLALAQSYAKNFGLYGQRVGAFSVITDK